MNQSSAKSKWVSVGTQAFLVVLVALAAISAVQGCRNALKIDGSIDLGMSLKAAQRLEHDDPYRQHFTEEVRPGELDPRVNPFPMMPMQAPSALMLLWPLGGLSWPSAKLAWLLANLVFTAGAVSLALRRFLPKASAFCYASVTALLLMSFPWRVVIGNGQHAVAALFFFLVSLELSDRGLRKSAGLALAVSFIKYSLILFLLPYFVWKRQWEPIVIAFAVHAAMTVGIAIWLNENPALLMVEAVNAGWGTLATSGYVDVFTLAKALRSPLLPWLTATLAGTALTYWIALTRRGDERTFVSILCFWSLIAIYHRSYDAVILLIPLVVALTAFRRDHIVSGLVFATIACSWILDRFVLGYTTWLDRPARAGSAYFFLLLTLYYGTLLALLWRQVLAPRQAQANRCGYRDTGPVG